MKLSTIFLKALNIYLFTKIFQYVKIVMLQWNILQYLTKILRQYFNCNERLEIFMTCFCNILCYVGSLRMSLRVERLLFTNELFGIISIHNKVCSKDKINKSFITLLWKYMLNFLFSDFYRILHHTEKNNVRCMYVNM